MKVIDKIFIFALMLCSCTVSVSDEDDVPAERGIVELDIQSAVSLCTSEDSTARALLIDSEPKFFLIRSDNSEIELSDAKKEVREKTYSCRYSLTIPEGSGYILRVEMYNSATGTEKCTVAGKSNQFDVVAGKKTSVAISCLPTNPLHKNIRSAKKWYLDLVPKEEMWYSFTADSDFTEIDVYREISYVYNRTNKINKGKVIIGIYDDTGAFARLDNEKKTRAVRVLNKNDVLMRVCTEAGKLYYLGLYGGDVQEEDIEKTIAIVAIKIKAK